MVDWLQSYRGIPPPNQLRSLVSQSVRGDTAQLAILGSRVRLSGRHCCSESERGRSRPKENQWFAHVRCFRCCKTSTGILTLLLQPAACLGRRGGLGIPSSLVTGIPLPVYGLNHSPGDDSTLGPIYGPQRWPWQHDCPSSDASFSCCWT